MNAANQIAGRERTALVIGAGIGGLACGVALQRAGWTVRIHERAHSARELGFGLALAPNALAALRELGVADTVVRAGSQVQRIEMRHADGRVMRRFGVPLSVPAVVALRQDLHGALLAAVGDGVIQFARHADSFVDRRSEVIVEFRDGTLDVGDMLIGADGIRSVIRARLHPDEPSPRASRFCALRGVAHGVSEHLGDLSGVIYFGAGVEAAAIRASMDAIYWYMSLLDNEVTEQTPEAVLAGRLQGFDIPFRAIVSASKPDDMRFDRLWERGPLERWGASRVTLLGDAAHPVLPHTGQGAAQALEDAVALGLAVSSVDDVAVALRRYETVRSRRTREFVRVGPRIAQMTTTRSVTIAAMRSAAVRLIPEALLARMAGRLQHDPHAELRRGGAARVREA
jgi:2-polyprenyl-6-methoxyphenol hydroxylase-like FAD-dependent oxidoreductase